MTTEATEDALPNEAQKKKEHIFSNLQQSSAIFSSGGGGDGKKVVGEGRGEEGVKLLFLFFPLVERTIRGKRRLH